MSILKKRSKEVLIYSITESKISNIFSALIIFLGSLGLLLVAISSYLGMDLFLFSEEISNFPFIPQGATMAFYGIGGLFISFYLWWILLWNIGGGFDIFDKKNKKVCFIRWGFPGKNRRIILKIPMNEIQSIRIIAGVQERGILTRTLTYESIVYMETIEQGFITLTRIEDNLTPPEIANKAGELAFFLGVPLLY
ncbi:photosystem I assembly protein Ycf4 (chloroplast) [Phaseolus vulgaris]|uniref:Photosystem I assembly protein Ycf4 n=1 Tax=Phaseolus vulgaris TaxID=3885 RepID=YCF4_PHAVU|nr:photosystem I assembly protein Ycf4 [Phaseolus vulgaris]A4GGB7.1 RecName: Full=Photosystem I assembly protein Ycf4 [Phaseolus vulgaris]ABH88098.1 photosystem I assembly protein ycf4 [Phaseolus vulgaris]